MVNICLGELLLLLLLVGAVVVAVGIFMSSIVRVVVGIRVATSTFRQNLKRSIFKETADKKNLQRKNVSFIEKEVNN